MSIYQRYASGEAEAGVKTPGNDDAITIFPLSGRLELTKASDFASKTTEEWINIFPNAAYFCGYDESLFGHLIIMVYENPLTERICTVSITKFGVTLYNDLILNENSRFFPACENLLPIHKSSKVRKALAITNLKNYNKLVNHPGNFDITRRWDETTAGILASKMNLLVDKKPNEFGNKLLQMGLITTHSMNSYLFDVVYDNDDPKKFDDNNKLVYLLGDQLDQLFDPLLEYSPETLESTYNIPSGSYDIPKTNDKIQLIVEELIGIQTNFTMNLVSLLQNFIIPLRIFILSSSDANGITKINHVFPPTIDEITRINCVLHDCLTRAKSFGYVEIFKVFGMILPYFYKPFIRHEANLKNFKVRFNHFHKKYEARIFKSKDINPTDFSINAIDSIITGSLLELPKLKLVLVRLYESVTKTTTKEELSTIDYYYNMAINIIDAFGGEDNEVSQYHADNGYSHERFNSKTRIFTPTGKILTELATNWPTDLQYGWLSRKVIGIFELKNIKPSNELFYDIEILIIFSDHLLFLRIVDDTYYVQDNDMKNLISIPDILMHSLVNEKPLPTLSTFPKMEVSYWCSINDVTVTTYKSFSSTTTSEEDFLRFFIANSENATDDSNFCRNYELLKSKKGFEVIELVNKAKILNKKQPFHLFRSNTSNLSLYSTAHTAINYDNEIVKSPIVLLLNLSTDSVNHYFEKNPQIFLIFTVNYTFDGDVQLIGFNRNGNVEVNEVVADSEFQKTLGLWMGSYINSYFNSFTTVTELMIRSNHMDLEYFLLQFQRYNSHEVREKVRERVREKVRGKKNKSVVSTIEKELPKNVDPVTDEVSKAVLSESQIPEVDAVKVKKKRGSFFRRLFGSKKSADVEFKELYKPQPTLQVNRKNSVSNSVIAPVVVNETSKPESSTVPMSKEESYDDMEPNFDNTNSQHLRNVSNAETVQYIQSPHKPQLQFVSEGMSTPVDSSRISPPLEEQPPLSPMDMEVKSVQSQKIQPVEPVHQSSQTAPLLTIKPKSRTKTQAKEKNPPKIQNSGPFIKPITTKPIVSQPQAKPQPKKPFKELFDSSESLDKRPLSEAFESDFEPDEFSRIAQEHFKLPYPEPQPIGYETPIQITQKTMTSPGTPRNPSLDVKSNFEFPRNDGKTFSDNVINDAIISTQSAMTKDTELASPAFTNDLDCDDDEANWIIFSRESSTNSLVGPISKFQYAVPNFSRTSSQRDGSFANAIRDVSAADSFRAQIEYFNSQISAKEPEGSVSSFTPSEVALNFSREIEQNFSSSGPKGYKYETAPKAKPEVFKSDFRSSRRASDANEIAKRFSGMTQSSIDDDEYFSPEEFTPKIKNKEFEHKGFEHGSFSSENTIINELLDQKVPVVTGASGVEDDGKNDFFLNQFGSMAYLSDILNGNVEI
ncbi:bud site selection protein 3 [[Candida] jaroonii]|uniref:Bud site selection protein 3 n=1 Tax=[Candida] jaroonii TaxID=467808 RepID=A0ACA9Y4W2_9ASCO|nr:bud site selection protein 3 [[Candida] jaroonii]